MTSYILEVGYNSCNNKEDVSDELKKVAIEICEQWTEISDEASLMSSPYYKSLFEYAESYGTCGEDGTNDLTLKIDKDEEGLYYLRQAASGGGESREVKEHLRRAFCRLVIREMHKKGMEVNLRVC